MTLGDVVPNEEFVSSTLQILQANGATATMNVCDSEGEIIYEDVDAMFYYGEGEDGLGWYQMDDWNNDGGLYNQNGFALAFGQGYVVDRVDTEVDAAIVFSGEVEKAPFTAELVRAQFNYIGNCAPTKITLGDLVVSSEFVSSTIQFLQANGATATMNVYDADGELIYEDVDAQFYYGEGEDGLGWYQMDDWNNDGGLYNQNGFELEAGDGFCADRVDTEEGAKIEFPSAYPDAE